MFLILGGTVHGQFSSLGGRLDIEGVDLIPGQKEGGAVWTLCHMQVVVQVTEVRNSHLLPRKKEVGPPVVCCWVALTSDWMDVREIRL